MDMSISSIIGILSIFSAGFAVKMGIPVMLSIAFVLFLSVVVGIINGTLVVYGHIPTFIATIIVMNIIKGIYFICSGGLPISGLPEFLNFLGAGYIRPIPFPIILMLVIAVILYAMTQHTALGRSFFAVGGNIEASKLSGIVVNFVSILAFVICAVLSGVGALGLTAKTLSGNAMLGENLLFDIMTNCCFRRNLANGR